MTRTAKLGFCLLTFGFLTACQDPTALKNYHSGILPMDSMEILLADVHVIESYRNRSYQQMGRDTVPPTRVKALYEKALAEHGVSLERFLESYRYYQGQNPIILDSLYEGVNQRLNELLTETYK
jgi:hypothetical protein